MNERDERGDRDERDEFVKHRFSYVFCSFLSFHFLKTLKELRLLLHLSFETFSFEYYQLEIEKKIYYHHGGSESGCQDR